MLLLNLSIQFLATRDKFLSIDHYVTESPYRTPYLHFSMQNERGEQNISFRFNEQGTDAGRLDYFYGLLFENKGWECGGLSRSH